MTEWPELLGTLRAFAIPMRTKFRGITVREGALIQGPAVGRVLAVRRVRARRVGALAGQRDRVGHDQVARPVRDSVPVNVTVPAVGPERAYEIVAGSGCRTAKVKVAERGQREDEDVERVAAVRDALDAAGPGGRIRVDANGGWSVEEAARLLRQLARYGLEYAEQPCATLDELARLRRRVDIPIAADESIRKAEDPLKVRAAGAADIVMVRCSRSAGSGPPCGWPRRAGCRSWCRARLTPRSASRPASRSPPPCPRCPTRAAWPRCRCWRGT